MSSKRNELTLFVVVLTVTSYLATGEIASAQEYLSPAAIVADAQGKTLYIAQTTAKQVAVFDIETSKVTATIAVGTEPTGLALSDDAALLYVTCAAPEGCVRVVKTDTGKVRGQFPAGYGAQAPVLSGDGKTLYVCNRFDNDISVISTEQGKQITSIPTLPGNGSSSAISFLTDRPTATRSPAIFLLLTRGNRPLKSTSPCRTGARGFRMSLFHRTDATCLFRTFWLDTQSRPRSWSEDGSIQTP